MAAGGRRERREAKLRDIMQDAQGNVIYTGELWRVAEDAGTQGPGRRTMLIAGTALLLATVIGSGCIDAKNAMGAFYVVLPYIGEVSALFGLVWNAVKVLGRREVKTYDLTNASERIPAACRLLVVFALAGFALSALYMALNGAGGDIADGAAYLMLKLASAAIAAWYRRLFRAAAWEKVS